MTSAPLSTVNFPDPSQSPWTHPDTGLLYEYNDATGVWLPVSGGGGEFPDIDKPDQQPGTIDDRYVNRTGDTMTGGLESPALTTGPDSDDKSILYMDDGLDAYNSGPHELEAKSGSATDWDAWITHNAPGGDNWWWDITYGNGKFVALAFDGSDQVMTSPDGVTWTQQSTPEGPSDTRWSSVTYGDGKFVAVAHESGDDDYQIMTSPDGEVWTVRDTPFDSGGLWASVTYGNNTFVAVGRQGVGIPGYGRVMTSPDGITWTVRSAYPSLGVWSSVIYVQDSNNPAFVEGKFVAVGLGGDEQVMLSPDGVTWTAYPAANSLTENNDWRSVTYGNGKLVAVAPNQQAQGTSNVMTSSDGVVWEIQTALPPGVSTWNSVVYAAGRFVAVAGWSSPDAPRVMSSIDGETWTGHTSPAEMVGYSIIYVKDSSNPELVNGRFVVVGGEDSGQATTLDIGDPSAGLYFNDKLLYTDVNIAPVYDKINSLANAVVNNAESIEVIAPTVFRGTWDYISGASPSDGKYTIDPDDGFFANTTKVILSCVDSRGVDHAFPSDPLNGFGNVTEGNYLTILNTENPYGLSGRVTATEFDANVNFVVTLSEVRAVDDPEGGPSSTGPAVIKVQKLIDPSNIDNINNIIDGLNGNFNNIADQRGVVWTNDEISLPAYLPSGNAIPNGKLYFNSRYLQLYIYVGGSWLGLL